MLNSVANLRPFFFNYAKQFAYVKNFVYLCTQFVCKAKRQSLNNTNMADILQTIERYRALGIDQQIDYKKFYLYSIITHSTALSIESENENCLVGPYEEVPNQRLKPI